MQIDYKALAETQPAIGRKPFIKGGARYGLVVSKVDERSQTKPKMKHGLVFEFRVTSAQPTKPDAEINSEGSDCVVYFDLLSEIGQKNLMSFLTAVAGESLKGNPEAVAKLIGGDIVGAPVQCYAQDKQGTKDPSKFYTNYAWDHVNFDEKDVAKWRAVFSGEATEEEPF